MKTHMLALVLGCALVSACGSLPPPPSSSSGAGLDIRLDPPPVHALIGQRTQLNLTSEQIDQLDEVGQQIHADNHPLLMQMEELRDRGGDMITQQELLQVAGRVHINNVQAMERVRGVLTPEQHAEVCALFGGRNTARGLRTVSAPNNGFRMADPASTHVNVGARTSNGPIWSWCADGTVTAVR